jgi:hypothetical protein
MVVALLPQDPDHERAGLVLSFEFIQGTYHRFSWGQKHYILLSKTGQKISDVSPE